MQNKDTNQQDPNTNQQDPNTNQQDPNINQQDPNTNQQDPNINQQDDKKDPKKIDKEFSKILEKKESGFLDRDDIKSILESGGWSEESVNLVSDIGSKTSYKSTMSARSEEYMTILSHLQQLQRHDVFDSNIVGNDGEPVTISNQKANLLALFMDWISRARHCDKILRNDYKHTLNPSLIKHMNELSDDLLNIYLVAGKMGRGLGYKKLIDPLEVLRNFANALLGKEEVDKKDSTLARYLDKAEETIESLFTTRYTADKRYASCAWSDNDLGLQLRQMVEREQQIVEPWQVNSEAYEFYANGAIENARNRNTNNVEDVLEGSNQRIINAIKGMISSGNNGFITVNGVGHIVPIMVYNGQVYIIDGLQEVSGVQEGLTGLLQAHALAHTVVHTGVQGAEMRNMCGHIALISQLSIMNYINRSGIELNENGSLGPRMIQAIEGELARAIGERGGQWRTELSQRSHIRSSKMFNKESKSFDNHLAEGKQYVGRDIYQLDQMRYLVIQKIKDTEDTITEWREIVIGNLQEAPQSIRPQSIRLLEAILNMHGIPAPDQLPQENTIFINDLYSSLPDEALANVIDTTMRNVVLGYDNNDHVIGVYYDQLENARESWNVHIERYMEEQKKEKNKKQHSFKIDSVIKDKENGDKEDDDFDGKGGKGGNGFNKEVVNFQTTTDKSADRDALTTQEKPRNDKGAKEAYDNQTELDSSTIVSHISMLDESNLETHWFYDQKSNMEETFSVSVYLSDDNNLCMEQSSSLNYEVEGL